MVQIKYKLDLENTSTHTVIQLLKEGKILEIKTDTLPALVCDPYNIKAIKQIFSLKKRPTSKQLPLFIPIKWNEKSLIDPWNTLEKKIIKKFWPGPLTIIKKFSCQAPKRPVLGDPKDTIALRCPNYGPLLEILNKFGPIASTSSNISGQMSENETKVRSTIIQVLESEETNENIRILRTGKIKKSQFITF
ncbi:MAG: L-threonylcarbamoyladenylate synthase [Bifidobacteriaceae bacterium]|jgi:tRNA threonylcarbamoyl adenosine modification protein (Sua5/YciO/YrdC/YwlC family)|nr:L-threonylcarbamoyladenylate synthase [Bifidobacteriaceae bacterium]